MMDAFLISLAVVAWIATIFCFAGLMNKIAEHFFGDGTISYLVGMFAVIFGVVFSILTLASFN